MATAKYQSIAAEIKGVEQQITIEECGDAFAVSCHPSFRELALWRSQNVLGVPQVAHHA